MYIIEFDKLFAIPLGICFLSGKKTIFTIASSHYCPTIVITIAEREYNPCMTIFKRIVFIKNEKRCFIHT